MYAESCFPQLQKSLKDAKQILLHDETRRFAQQKIFNTLCAQMCALIIFPRSKLVKNSDLPLEDHDILQS